MSSHRMERPLRLPVVFVVAMLGGVLGAVLVWAVTR